MASFDFKLMDTGERNVRKRSLTQAKKEKEIHSAYSGAGLQCADSRY